MNNGLERINGDKIIACNSNSIIIISISKLEIIENIPIILFLYVN